MEGSSKNNQFSDSDREDNLDLTLRLGAPGNDTEDAEENKNTGSNTFHGFSGMDNYAANDKGNFTMHGNMQFGGSSSSYGGVEVGNVGAPYMALTTGMYAPNLAYGAGLLPQNPPTPTRKRKPDDSKFCRGCGVTSTPLWRKGPDGPQTLCNACGLRYLRVVKRDGE